MDWRYWITYAGKVTANTEEEAKAAADYDVMNAENPTIVDFEVEEVGEGE